MEWKDVGKLIASACPLLSGVLAATGVGAPVAAAVSAAGAILSATLGVPNTPDAVATALATNPDAAVRLQQIESTHGENMQALLNAAQAQELAASTGALATVNETMRTEDQTRVFSWRDFWGYVSGAAFAFVVLVVGYLVGSGVYLNKPELLAAIPPVIGAFTTLFGIAATVLGVQSSIEAHHAGMVDRIAAGKGSEP